MHEHLGLKKKRARWLLLLLTEDQKNERVRICRLCLTEFEPYGLKRFSDVTTEDECRIYFFATPDMQPNMVWLGNEEPRPQILTIFNSQGLLRVDVMPQ